MASQEEYLDNLLKDVINGEQASDHAISDGVQVDFLNGLPAESDNTADLESTSDVGEPVVSSLAEDVVLPEDMDIAVPDLEIATDVEEPVVSSLAEDVVLPEDMDIAVSDLEIATDVEEPVVSSLAEDVVLPEDMDIAVPDLETATDIEEPIISSLAEDVVLPEDMDIAVPDLETATDIEEPIISSLTEDMVLPEDMDIAVPDLESASDVEEPIVSSLAEDVVLPEDMDIAVPDLESVPDVEEPMVSSMAEDVVLPEDMDIAVPDLESASDIEEPIVSSLTEDVDLPEENHADKDRYDIQDTMNMSSEEIERILAESAGNAAEEEKVESGSVDLETLLNDAEESNLKDINDMLLKADRNEPVDEGIVTLLEQAQQQNAEMDWKDIEEQSQSAQPKEKKGFFKFFEKLLKGKKGAKAEEDAQETEQTENRRQDGTGVIENVSKRNARIRTVKEGRTLKETAGTQEGQKSVSESETSANSEMDELFGAMEAFSSEQKTPTDGKDMGQQDTQRAEETAKDAAKKAEGTAEDPAEDEWMELQGLSLGNSVGKPSGSQGSAEEEAQAVLRNAGLEAVLGDTENREPSDDEIFGLLGDEGFTILPKKPEKTEEPGAEDETDEFGDPDTLDILGEMGAPTGADPGAEEGKEAAKENGREKKAKKEKSSSDKKGIFDRLLDFLTQEDPEVEEEQQLILSDENDAILKELNEENSKKNKKKAKKSKNADGKADETDSEDDEESGEKKGKQKKQKPKKVREPKQSEPEEPGKRLSKKRVSLIFLICGTIGAVILILGNVMTDFSDKKKAVAAFYEGDYETCYQNLMGKQLNESQQIMYGKSESILRMRLWMREYEMFVQAGQEPEALDSLMQSVHDYPALYQYSIQWNAGNEVRAIYSQMLLILESKYGLTEERAEEIANERDDLVYSQIVRTIAGGGSIDWNGQSENPPEEGRDTLKDLLPEEEELGNTVFAD